MRVVIQRVQHASVTIEGTLHSKIGKGYLILLGVCEEDTSEDVEWLVKKIVGLRVFEDENGVMNRSIMEEDGENKFNPEIFWILKKIVRQLH